MFTRILFVIGVGVLTFASCSEVPYEKIERNYSGWVVYVPANEYGVRQAIYRTGYGQNITPDSETYTYNVSSDSLTFENGIMVITGKRGDKVYISGQYWCMYLPEDRPYEREAEAIDAPK